MLGQLRPDAVHDVCRRLQAELRNPIQIGDVTLRIRASIGVTHVDPRNQRTADDLLYDADHAMYQAKFGKEAPRPTTVNFKPASTRRHRAAAAAYSPMATRSPTRMTPFSTTAR